MRYDNAMPQRSSEYGFAVANLEAVAARFPPQNFDLILNGGDSLVYGPFPNQTIDWLRTHGALSILGNTDRHVITLVKLVDEVA